MKRAVFTITRSLALSLVVVLLTAAPMANAIPVFDISAGNSTSLTWPGDDLTLGYDFTVLDDLTINALAIFDKGSDGLASAHEVGLWGPSGLIVSVTVGDGTGDGTVASASEHGEWVYEAFSSITLLPGSYTVGAFYAGSNTDPIMVAQTVINNLPLLAEYDLGQYIYDSTFQRPTGSYPPNEDQYFGPTLLSVPDAGATIGLLGLAMAGLALVRRRFD